ncbi:MAG: hypothetical protein ASQ68_gp20 [Yellowstone Lake virophage 6]|uniref:hypothetical protein n=1 Tax=Yellowstone Lake virophage 6 TaxID=1557034 RepID=UPI000535E08B|nr:MAG: hypothetical protein ASQ68_gp20 [Yellowstone Lake virophage 6]AIW01910.1 MAG: hypothetical protein YSLV6_ORF20 [Yellowstone Lake virophage 6]
MNKSKTQSVLIPKKTKSKLHAVNFPKVGFTLKQSHKWLMKHNYKIPEKVDETENFYRYRQRRPDKRYTYTTEVLPNGVELVLMWKKDLKGGNCCDCDDNSSDEILIDPIIELIEKIKKVLEMLESLKGGNIDNQELAKFVDAGYKTKSEAPNVDGYVLDKELSTKRDKVYYDPNTGKAVHTIAGTDKAKDWSNNLLIPLGLHQYTNRYKNAEKIQKEANKKYGKDNLSLVSHSQSGNIAENLANKKLVGDENITLNPAIIGSHNKKLKVVKSSGDIVSALTFTNKKDKVLKSKTWNPFTEHSSKILTRKKK